MVSIDYLESERKKIWEEITELKRDIDKKTSDFEQDAKSASKKCSEFKNKCESAKDESNTLFENIKKISSEIEQSNVASLITDIRVVHDELLPKKDKILAQITELESLFTQHSTYVDQIKKLDEIADSADDSSTKIDTILGQLTTRKKEIDQLYYEIFGYSRTDPTSGEITTVVGLKEELDKSYSELKGGFEQFSKDKNIQFDAALVKWEAGYSGVLQKINSLLPNALTAGLSHAYSKKKDDEIAESAALDVVFKRYIKGLIAISCIPFVISVYLLLFTSSTLEDTILKMPRLVLSILPLYIPVLWVAYSANRKMNLSKRLIEEYTHKEVLSKTFEGLANQIQHIEDSEISADLKTRLLYNILEVSSENPGKLISDYNKSDHPLMDALDKSMKLTNAIDHLSRIPGMSKLVNVLDNKSKELLDKEAEKVVAGIDRVIDVKP